MDRFMRKNRGAVSIFLLIILLPMMTMAGVFVDLARTKVAQEVVTSSAELALNTVLTNYDKDLKDYFGLLASSQNTNDVISVSKEYFKDSLISAGFDTSEAQIYVDNIVSAFVGDGEIHDMLQISDGGTTEISRTENGAMNNPALIKEGINEFMKYRSPVNGVASLFEKITEADVAGKLEDSSKEAVMIEKREAFYTAEKELIKQAEKTYDAIKAYEKFEAHTGDKVTSEAFLNKLSTFLAKPTGKDNETMEDILRDGHYKMTKNLYNTHNTDGDLSVTLVKEKYISTQAKNTTYSSNTKASSTKIQNIIKEFSSAINTYYSAKTTLQNKWDSIGKMKDGDWPIQYWVKLTNSCSSAYSNYVTAANNVWKISNKLENAWEYLSSEDIKKETMSAPSNSYVSFTTDQHNKATIEHIYEKLTEKYDQSIYSDVEQNKGCTVYWNVTNQIDSLNTSTNNDYLKATSVNKVYTLRNTLNNYVKDTESAAKLAKTAESEAKKLAKKVEEYEEAFEAWDKAAFDKELDSSSLATNEENGDRTLINKLKDGGKLDLSKDEVEKLEKRLKNIRTLFETLHDDMEDIKYNGTSVTKLTKYKTFRNASKLSADKIPVNNSALEQYAKDTFTFTIKAQLQRIEIYENRTSEKLDDGNAYVITDSFYPKIDIDRYEMNAYTWLENKFGTQGTTNALSKSECGFNVSDKSSAKEADKGIGKKEEDTGAASTEENTKGKNFGSDWKGATLPSKGEGAEEKTLGAKITDAGNYAKSLFSNFTDTFMDTLEDMRDDLYTEDYIFSMFTHDTFDNEGYYANLSEEAQKTITASNASTKYTDAVKKAWKDSDEINTLTLNPRNAQNNWCYGGEIEYILYGNKTNAANKTTAYANIYLIRYALDLAPVFTVYWEDEILNTIATALEVFAYIPAAFTKTIACLAITAAEAGVDISYLRQGIPVLIYKTSKKDVFCNYETVFMGSSKQTDTTNGIKLQYSDYLKIFLFVKLISDENIVYLRIGDVIQANMSLVTGKLEGEGAFALSKSQVYYTLNATATVEPMWSRLLAIDDLGDLSTSTGWRSIQINMTRGY